MPDLTKNIFSACHVRLFGDENRAKNLIGFGKKLLYKLATEMSFNNLQVLARPPVRLTDGSLVQVAMHYGTAQIFLYSPPLSKQQLKKGTKEIEHAYILVRMYGWIGSNTFDPISGWPACPEYPSVPVKDKCFVYDVGQKELVTPIVDYDSDTITAFLEEQKDKETVLDPLWSVRVCGHEPISAVIDGNYVGDTDDTYWFNPDINDWEFLEVNNADGTEPEIRDEVNSSWDYWWITESGWNSCFLAGRGSGKNVTKSNAWVGTAIGDTPGSRWLPDNLRLDYMGNFREENETEPFHTSFQVIRENGAGGSGAYNANTLKGYKDIREGYEGYTLNTVIGELAKYNCAGSRTYLNYNSESSAYIDISMLSVSDEIYFGEPIESFFYIPPWYCPFAFQTLGVKHDSLHSKGYSVEEIDEFYNYTYAFVDRYDSAGVDENGKPLNKKGSRILTQLYTCQARKRVSATTKGKFVGNIEMSRSEFTYGGSYPTPPPDKYPITANAPSASKFNNMFTHWFATIRDGEGYKYVPSNGELLDFEIPEGYEELETLEDRMTKAQSLGMGVLAASDLYPDASNTDPREQTADPFLTDLLTALWLSIYPEEYMEAPWDFEEDIHIRKVYTIGGERFFAEEITQEQIDDPDTVVTEYIFEDIKTWVRQNHGDCPQFRIDLKHFEPFTETVELKEGEN